jgi:hypothetical protein
VRRGCSDTTPPPRGVKRSPCASVDLATTPQPCPPASPSAVVGRLSQGAGTQQLPLHQHCSPSCTAPLGPALLEGVTARGGTTTQRWPSVCSPLHTASYWASVARGETGANMQREASSVTPADAIALYRQCVALGIQARFTVKNIDRYETACLPPLLPSPPRPQPTPTAPQFPTKTPSPTAPQPFKKPRKRRCELELLRDGEHDLDQSLPISPPAVSLTPSPPPPSPTPPPQPSTSPSAAALLG